MEILRIIIYLQIRLLGHMRYTRHVHLKVTTDTGELFKISVVVFVR